MGKDGPELCALEEHGARVALHAWDGWMDQGVAWKGGEPCTFCPRLCWLAADLSYRE